MGQISGDTWVIVIVMFVLLFGLGSVIGSMARSLTKAIKDLEDKVAGHLHGLAHTSVRTETAITDIHRTLSGWQENSDNGQITDHLYQDRDLLADIKKMLQKLEDTLNP